VYDVWIYDSALDVVHDAGHWIREVHVPNAGLSFNTGGYTTGLMVFRPESQRYASEPVDNKNHPFPENMPARKIRDIELTKEDVDVFKEILRLKEKGATVAQRILVDK